MQVEAQKLTQYISQIEALEEQKQVIADQIKDVYNEAKSVGFDAGILRQVVKLRKKDKQRLMEEQTLIEIYMEALDK